MRPSQHVPKTIRPSAPIFLSGNHKDIKFVRAKKRLPEGLRAFAAAPLNKAPFEPDVVHGVYDVLQAYHLGNDWCAE